MLTREQKDLHPYYSISRYYRKKFGMKVYKIPVTTADDCPNRRGLKGMQTCIFCDPWGSAARAESLQMDLRSQITTFRDRVAELYNAEKFLVYFQAYTNTFAKLSAIRQQFDIALEYPFVTGLVVGTRPDCLSKALLDMWQSYSEQTYLSVELGVQSFIDRHVEFQRRGHSVQDSLRAIEKIKQLEKVDLGVHFIFGNPDETDEEIVFNAQMANQLEVDNVKLHNLHVLKDTPLADLYEKGEFLPISLEEYARRVELFLQHLAPDIPVHRLTALASRRDELIAPEWTGKKMQSYQFCMDFLSNNQSFQGQHHQSAQS